MRIFSSYRLQSTHHGEGYAKKNLCLSALSLVVKRSKKLFEECLTETLFNSSSAFSFLYLMKYSQYLNFWFMWWWIMMDRTGLKSNPRSSWNCSTDDMISVKYWRLCVSNYSTEDANCIQALATFHGLAIQEFTPKMNVFCCFEMFKM